MARPSIILIVVDTLRADYLGCYGDSGGLTANIDELAGRGVRFANAYSASNFTAPAFASLFTSLYPVRHGIYDFRIKRLPPSGLMDLVKNNGYTRKAVVDFGFFKSFLGRSFDDMESLTDLAVNWSTEGPVVETRRAVEWIGQHKDDPFFLFFHISPPHAPYRFPRKYYELITRTEDGAQRTKTLRAHEVLGALFPTPDGDRIPQSEIDHFNRCAPRINEVSVGEDCAAVIRDLYRMEVRVVDEMVGLLVKELERLGTFADTIVSFSSDHGEELWDHGLFGHGGSGMPNEVIRTPWIVCCPSRIGIPRVVDTSVSHTNILVSLLDLAGLELTNETRRASVAGLIDRGAGEPGADTVRESPPVFCETARRISVVHGDHKLIAPSRRTRFSSSRERLRYKLSRATKQLTGKARGKIELYDLRTDGGERKNIAETEKSTVAALLRLVDGYYKSSGATIGEGEALSRGEEEKIKRELEELGYL